MHPLVIDRMLASVSVIGHKSDSPPYIHTNLLPYPISIPTLLPSKGHNSIKILSIVANKAMSLVSLPGLGFNTHHSLRLDYVHICITSKLGFSFFK